MRNFFNLNSSLSRDNASLASRKCALVFRNGLRGDPKHPRKSGTVSGSVDRGGKDVFAHDALKFRTIGSVLQAKNKTDFSAGCGDALGMDTEKAFAKRLGLALDAEGFPPLYQGRQVALGKLMDTSQRTAANWLNGDKLPAAKNMIELAEKLHVSSVWLISGVGEMRPFTLTDQERQLISELRGLPQTDRERVFQLARVFTPKEPHPNAA